MSESKKKIDWSKLSFNELKDKAKEIEGAALMTRFELVKALKKANNETICPLVEKLNPTELKKKMRQLKELKVSLGEEKKKFAKSLKSHLSSLKKKSRISL